MIGDFAITSVGDGFDIIVTTCEILRKAPCSMQSERQAIARGNFFMLFTNRGPLFKYLRSALIGCRYGM
jgi:hypothetical protein